MRRKRRLDIIKWLGWIYAPIAKNGAFFVFMFALGWLCTQTELMPYYLRERGAKPYALAGWELLLDIWVVCALLTVLPRKLRLCVKGLLYIVFYGTAIADMFCYERFESTLTPTMLMLVGETNGREAGEFLTGYVGWGVLQTGVGKIVGLIALHIGWTLLRLSLSSLRKRMILPKLNEGIAKGCRALAGVATAVLLYMALTACWGNKTALLRLFSYETVGQVEHELTRKDKGNLYQPVYRLAFGIYANQLAADQVEQLETASAEVRVDSCVFRVPNIVLVIGESYNKHHSQLYGYAKPTTPRQAAMASEGSLVAFSDVVASWNLTSFVFKHLFSLWAVGDSGAWNDRPLFPEVFRKAGYHVTFITNQFLPQAKEAVYDFSGGFFLNNPELAGRLFDTRNSELHRYDDGVLADYDRLAKENTDHNLVILHLMGQHVDYRARYPQPAFRHFTPEMYDRPELDAKQRRILADYDNSLVYNDSIVAAVTERFADKDAVVIYVPDHGEEIFDGSPYMYGRMHSANIDYRLARNEMEIPFWIWGSPEYIRNHPYGWLAIQNAKDRPLMTDVLPHLLLFLGGIYTPDYRPEYNIITPEYDAGRPRILKGETDYNKLKK